MKYILIILIILLVGCSSKIERRLDRIVQEMEQSQILLRNLDQLAMDVNSAIRQKQIFEELRKTNKILKKEFEKGSDFWCRIIGPGMSICKKYDSTVPPPKLEKPKLNQFDIDKNKNNSLQ